MWMDNLMLSVKILNNGKVLFHVAEMMPFQIKLYIFWAGNVLRVICDGGEQRQSDLIHTE